MSIVQSIKGLVWPQSAPVPDRRLKVPRTNGAALKGGWIMPDPWAGYWSRGIALTEGRSASYAEIYQRSPWIYIVANKLVRGIGRLPLKPYGTKDGGDRFRLRDAPLATLLNAPYERASPTTLKQRIVGDLAIFGDALVVMGRDRATAPANYLQPVAPFGWRIDDEGNYRSSPIGEPEQVIPPWKMLHFKFYNPGSELWGLAPLEPLRQALLVEDGAERLAAYFFENGAAPGLALETDQDLKDDSIARLRAQFEGRHVGGSNAGRPLVLTGGLKARPWDVNLDKAALPEHRRLWRDLACAIYDVAPVLVGILDRATFSNVEELHLALYMDTLGPWLTLIEETIEAQLLRGVEAYRGQFVEFSLEEVLKGNIEARYNALTQAIGGPWMARNEGRRVENLDRLGEPAYDVPLTPLNMTAAPTAPAPEATPAKGRSPVEPNGKEAALNGH
jgi:HK97 family phage portal protein